MFNHGIRSFSLWDGALQICASDERSDLNALCIPNSRLLHESCYSQDSDFELQLLQLCACFDLHVYEYLHSERCKWNNLHTAQFTKTVQLIIALSL